MTEPTPDQTPAITATPADVEAAFAGTVDARALPGPAGEQPVFAVEECAAIVAGRYGEGKTVTARAVLWEMIHAGYTPVSVDTKSGDVGQWLAPQPTGGDQAPTRPVIVAQRADATEVALAMAGHHDVSHGEQEAAERGIDPVTYRRLYPAVTGDLADQLHMRIVFLASHLAAHLAIHADDDRISGQLTQDPRTTGFRLALFEARRLATTEPMRKLAMFTEWAMNSIAAGEEDLARAKLALADAILA